MFNSKKLIKQIQLISLVIPLLSISLGIHAANKSENTKVEKSNKAEKTQHKKSAYRKTVSDEKNTKKISNEKPKESLSNIHERIEKLKKDLDQTKEAHADVADALKKSEKAISETNRKLFEIKQDHQKYSETLQSLQQKKSSLETTLGQQTAQLSKQLYQQYVHGETQYLPILLDAKNPSEISRQLQYLSYVGHARSDLIDSMQHNLGKVTKLNEETASTLKQVAELKNQQEAAKHNLEKEKENKAKVLEKLSSKIDAQRNEISKLKRDEKNLSELVEKLSKAAQIKASPKKLTTSTSKSDQTSVATRTEEKVPSQPITVAKNETLPSAGFDGGDFSALRGKLNLPVRGEVSNRFGATREDTGVTWKGLFIRSAEGSEVKCIANGKIVFADWMRGFGNLLIIDHGDGYMSLYGNNQALLRKMGDNVKSGDTIASVGNSGGNETAGLYYELRKQSKPFDPMSWSVAR
ncbi:MAG: peptidoglycan DD-metalloendopeptidase family protein [Candidatus Methylopumilus sp.]|nr:peptidoglycan DD-metalloendopeptidase family protein [Candidatus Methylopumilus sp.]